MKTLAVIVAIFGSSIFSSTYAKGPLNMNEKLDEVVRFENNELPIKTNETEFVKVSFKINESGKLEVLEMNYSDEKIKTQLIEKLSEIKVEEEYNSEDVYNYNFTLSLCTLHCSYNLIFVISINNLVLSKESLFH